MGTKENPEDTEQSSASSEVPQEGPSKKKVRTDLLRVWLAQAPRGWNTSTQKRKSHDSDES